MLRTFITMLFISLWLSLSEDAFATKVLDFALVKDGSVEPAGDRLTLSAVFLPGETALLVEMRPMEMVGEGEKAVYQPIKAANEAKQDFVDDGGFLILKTKLERPEGNGQTAVLVSKDLVIPYANFKLEPGTHHLYYEVGVVALSGEKKADALVSASRLTDVTIEDGIRTSLTRKKKKEGETEYTSKPREIKAYKLSQKGELVEQTTEVVDYVVSAAAYEPESVKVNIPGQFKRKEVAGMSAIPVASQASFTPEKNRTVRFATNRNIVNNLKNPENAFGKEIAPLTYGYAVVNIPLATHKKGNLKTEGWFGKNPNKDFYVESIRKVDSEDFYKELSNSSVLLYVHGYQNSFNDAMLKAAQLQHDVEFPGKVMAFTWPSAAAINAYHDDENTAEKSVLAMSIVIQRLVEEQKQNKAPNKGLSIVCHSMGNRVALFALNKLISDGTIEKNDKIIKNLVLAAPDVDINQFGSIIPRISSITQNITFYYSSKDTALDLSEGIHPMNRAGLFPIFFDGMDTISVDNVNSRWLSYGHGYFAASDKVLLDLNLNFVHGLIADKRQPPLAPKDELKGFPGFPHYNFKQ